MRLITSTLLLSVCLVACASAADVPPQGTILASDAAPAKTAVLNASAEMTQEQRFEAWKADFTQRAIAKGYSPTLLATTVGQATINERALERDANQPEFTRPVWAYIQSAANPTRIANGKAEMAEHSAEFNRLEATYGVPRTVLSAIWGLESAYGQILGTHNIINSLATFAFEGRRTRFGENQLYAALDLIQSGAVRQDQLVGSWAGAMGMTQFIPTTFRDYAVDFDGNGNTDLWTSELDALASAANYLTRSGWKPGVPVMSDVSVPDNFDYAQSETVKMTVGAWMDLGVRPSNGMQFSDAAKAMEAKLLVPAGHKGPKLLAFHNFDVIKKYNNSTSYVMGITSLASALNDYTVIRSPWPEGDQPISFEDKKRMQERLTALGYDTKGVDGMIGPATRRAIRAWQSANGLPADGYVEQSLFKRMMGAQP